MTTEGIADAQLIEPMLEQLIRQHGIDNVDAELRILFGGNKARWNDFQSVSTLAHRIANRLEAVSP